MVGVAVGVVDDGCLVLMHNPFFRNESLSSTQSFEASNGFLNIISVWADNHSVCVSKGIRHSLR